MSTKKRNHTKFVISSRLIYVYILFCSKKNKSINLRDENENAFKVIYCNMIQYYMMGILILKKISKKQTLKYNKYINNLLYFIVYK